MIDLGSFLLGCLAGGAAVFALTIAAIGITTSAREWTSAFREGSEEKD